MMSNVGIYDSGCGGLSVLNNLLKSNQNYNIYYYADSLNNPWGNKSKEELHTILVTISNWFNSNDIDYVICGCNTTYSLFKNELDKIFNKPVHNLLSQIGTYYTDNEYSILSTENTSKSKIFSNIIKESNPNAIIEEIACPGLANAIETNNTNKIKDLVKQFMSETTYDSIILGCTHYPLIINELTNQYPKKTYLDPSDHIIIKTNTIPSKINNSSISFKISGNEEEFKSRLNVYLTSKHYKIQSKIITNQN